MGLLEDLRAAAPALDAQFQPASNEIQGLLGALVQYEEHGQAFLDAAAEGTDQVTELVAPEATPEERDQAAAEATRAATSKQTKVKHETGAAA